MNKILQNSDIGETGVIFPISLEETRGEGEEHQRQKSSTEATTNTVYTILEQPRSHHQSSRYSCYYCYNFETNIKQDYESHVVLKHPGKLCYLLLLKEYHKEIFIG